MLPLQVVLEDQQPRKMIADRLLEAFNKLQNHFGERDRDRQND